VPIRHEVAAVPTAPTFTKRFYDKFGHDNVTELAKWLNGMDLTYRTQLRDLNEANFARFEAKLDQRIGEVKSELRREITETKAELVQEIADTKVGLRDEISQLRTEMRAGFAELENRLTGRLIRWMFVFWTGTTVTLLGAMFAITRL
jgi:predicted metal-dependent HD superfamily phosphohydrolase